MLAIRRPAAALGALAAVSVLAAAAAPAHADGQRIGTASATTARLGLDVRLLTGAVDIPVDVSLNAIHAPDSAEGAVLRTSVQGVQGGVPQTLVEAVLGHSSASADAHGSHAEVDLVTARVQVPGLLLRDVLGLKEVSARADCPAHGRPTAEVNVLGQLRVLGVAVSLSAGGPTHVAVPGVGVVDLELSKKTLTSTTAAATALELSVTVNPLSLNVAKVTGSIELAVVGCSKAADDSSALPSPSASAGGAASSSASADASASAPAVPASVTSGAASPSPAPATTDLAVTGGGSATPLIAGAALLLLGAGAAALVLARRRRS
ncbi:hypothetical protein ABIA33_002717 [Streptacidiphilus sp. MAP12-16]|uniref:SCO1860 family LAETG-anchored protein n=1 Tax=Streptacidiphilus sp. MAP12-16 TaxID=3156300 RepID=UPI003514233A